MAISRRPSKNGKARFQAQVVNPFTRKRISKSFDRRSDANAWKHATLAEMRRGREYDPTIASRLTLGEALRDYTEGAAVARKGGAKQELRRIERWLEHPYASRPLASLLPVDFDEYIRERLDAGRAARTVRLEMSVISQCYTFLRKKRRIYSVENPVPDCTLPPIPPLRTRRLSENEANQIAAFLAEYANPYALPAFTFTVETGLRIGELLRLQWEDVALDAKKASFRQARKGCNPDAAPVTRTVPLTDAAITVLRGLAMTLGHPAKGQTFRTTYEALHKALERACKAFGIVDFTWHDLRHEAASRMASRGLPLSLVGQVLGHKNLQITRGYQHFTEEEVQAAFQNLR